MATLREILPHFIYNRLKKREPDSRNNYLKSFRSYEDAAAVGSYNNKRIAEVVAVKTKKYIANISSLIKERQDIQNLLVFHSIVRQIGESKMKVIELGGACGAFYFFISNFFPDAINSWIVIETDEMVKIGSTDFGNDTIKFTSDIGAIQDNKFSSICIAQGALQYIPQPLTFLAQLLNSDYEFIYISRLVANVSSNSSLITVQSSQLRENGPGTIEDVPDEIVQIAYTILAKTEFLSILAKSKYEIRFQFEESESYSLSFQDGDIRVQNLGVLLSLK